MLLDTDGTVAIAALGIERSNTTSHNNQLSLTTLNGKFGPPIFLAI